MIDFHCHLDLYPDPPAVVTAAHEDQVAVLSVTTTPSAFVGTAALAANRPLIQTALGLHPELAHQRSQELSLFDKLVTTTPFVGEIGLDGSARFAQTRRAQADVFAHILRACAEAGGRVLSIHSRGAVPDVLEELRANPRCGTPVLHWFSGTVSQAHMAAEQGCWFSVGLPMLTSNKGRDIVAALPPDRILTETDGPFVTREGRPSVPQDVAYTTRLIADIWGMDVADAEAKVTSNLRALVLTQSSDDLGVFLAAGQTQSI